MFRNYTGCISLKKSSFRRHLFSEGIKNTKKQVLKIQKTEKQIYYSANALMCYK